MSPEDGGEKDAWKRDVQKGTFSRNVSSGKSEKPPANKDKSPDKVKKSGDEGKGKAK